MVRAESKCSFCGKPQDKVATLVAGPGVFVCNECVDLCDEILTQEADREAGRPKQGRQSSRREVLARCSFCAKPQYEVRKLIAGPGVYICDECVRLSQGVLAEEPRKSSVVGHPMADDVDTLLSTLSQARAAREQLDESLKPAISKLRERGISWARIGQELGMSRQAAWERFSGED